MQFYAFVYKFVKIFHYEGRTFSEKLESAEENIFLGGEEGNNRRIEEVT
jgi:hypothetical protein